MRRDRRTAVRLDVDYVGLKGERVDELGGIMVPREDGVIDQIKLGGVMCGARLCTKRARKL